MSEKKIHLSSIKITIIFLVIGSLWIILSDRIVLLLTNEIQTLSYLQTFKGWFFVLISSIVIYFLVNNEISQKEEHITNLNSENEWQKLLISNLPDTNVFLVDLKFELLFHASEKSVESLNSILKIELKNADNFTQSGSKSKFLVDWLPKALKGEQLHLAVKGDNILYEIHGIPVKDKTNKIDSILVISFNRTLQKELLEQFSIERKNYAKLSEKYHNLNNELADSYNQLKTYNIELIENNERYSAFIQQTSEAVYRFDLKKTVDLSLPLDMQVATIFSKGYLAEYNPAYAEIYNLSQKKNYLGKSIAKISSQNNYMQSIELIGELAKHNYLLKNHESFEYDLKGHTHYFLNNIVGIVTDNKLIRLWGTKMETTKQKKYERELILAKRKAEQSDMLKTAFLANMSHEIRTPLNGILGFSELICKADIDNTKRERYFKIIQTSNQQLLRIINDILDISRIQTGQLSITKVKFSLNSLLNDIEISTLQTIKQKHNTVELIVKKALNNDEDTIYTDRVRLYQVLTNLTNNALKFTDKGSITISYEKKSDSIMEFNVVDSGIGIPEEYLGSIFDQFRQVEEFASRNYGGTGLGLSISKGLVELLGGYISVESEENSGSNFKFTIKYT